MNENISKAYSIDTSGMSQACRFTDTIGRQRNANLVHRRYSLLYPDKSKPCQI